MPGNRSQTSGALDVNREQDGSEEQAAQRGNRGNSGAARDEEGSLPAEQAHVRPEQAEDVEEEGGRLPRGQDAFSTSAVQEGRQYLREVFLQGHVLLK